DPPYEVKADYSTVPKLIADVQRKWNVGILALWYPILTDMRHRPMLAALEALNLPKAFRHEVHFPPAREGHGMVGSGMFMTNTPFGTSAEAERLSDLFRRL
ncbi:MAG: 23S rRNA (adenine(2030)-N(6))-methyltransferase RlmJ, partial [Rhodobacteraceae bacterium]|nr:23S rRNA (adenine(2030)-N(6))-methyltransferase RlmJ [Paracoccaceae bacterium]